MSVRVQFACDFCGASVFGPPANGSLLRPLPDGWITGGGHLVGPHLCPRCAGEFRAEAGAAPAPLAPEGLTISAWLERRKGVIAVRVEA